MQFLIGFNETYSAIRKQILLMNLLPIVHQAYAAVSQEEKQRILSVSHTTLESDSSAAMIVRNNNKPNSNSTREEDLSDLITLILNKILAQKDALLSHKKYALLVVVEAGLKY